MLRRSLPSLIVLCGVVPAWAVLRQAVPSLEPIARVEHKEIDEQSGIVKSLKYPGVYWVENDSGDTARIFAIHLNGTVAAPKGVSPDNYHGVSVTGATNVDWEDMTREGKNIIISDMGNNGNKRKDLGVYIIAEPNPNKDAAVSLKQHIPIAYPDQKEFPPAGVMGFDCEALFSLKGKLYFLTKERLGKKMPGNTTKLYRLDSRDPNKVNVLTKLDERKLDGWTTSACLSPNGKTLAVLTSAPGQSVWLFPTSVKDGRFLSGPARQLPFTNAKQCEGICWEDANTVIITNEQRELFRLKVTDAKPIK